MTSMETLESKLGVKLKKEQREAICSAESQDVLCVLPTGFGKTKIIQGIALASDDNCVVIIQALSAILQQQRAIFKPCVCITEDFVDKVINKDKSIMNDVEKLKAGYFKFIIAHPEQFIRPEFKKLLMTNPLASKIQNIVVDEAHCILSWGASEFRPAYKKLGMMRAVLPYAKMLALTATATLGGQSEIIASLHMRETKVITASPDRPNVFLETNKRPPSSGGLNSAENSVWSCADPLFEALAAKGQNFPKTILYCQLKWCGILQSRAKTCYNTSYVRQYHSPQSQAMKTIIVEEMAESDSRKSKVRLLLATEAYGMGMDVADIRNVIHIGPPATLDTFVQEIGRCGRDGAQGKSCVHFNASDLGKAHMTKEMSEYCTTDKCRREFLLKYFSFSAQPDRDRHYCCDNCLKFCKCEMCSDDCEEASFITVEQFPKVQIPTLREMLVSYFEAENSIVGPNVKSAELKTGLSTGLIDSLCKNVPNDLDQLKRTCPFLTSSQMSNIFSFITCLRVEIES